MNKITAYITQLRQHVSIPLFAMAYTLIVNQFLGAALGMLYWALAARLFSADIVGQNSTLISTILLLGALAEFSLKSAMGRFVPRAGRGIKKLIVYTYLVNTVVALLMTGAFFWLGSYFSFTNDLMTDMKLLPLALLVLPIFWTIFYVQDGVLTGLREAKWVLYENLAYNVIKIVVLVGLFFTGNRYGLLASWFLPVPLMVIFVNALIFMRFVPRYLREHQEEPGITLKEAAKSVGGDHVGTILAETGIRILPLLVLNMLGKSASAYFYEAWLIGNTIYLIAYNFASSFAVEAASNRAQIVTISRHILIQKARLVLPLALAVFIFAEIGLNIFGADYAREGTALLRWLALAAVPMILNIWYLGYARITGKNLGIIRNQGLTCFITLGLSYLLIGAYGITSIGVAWFVAQLVVALIVLVEHRRDIFLHKAEIQ
jgi:O-antigen/teichoic acid export membrane protein